MADFLKKSGNLYEEIAGNPFLTMGEIPLLCKITSLAELNFTKRAAFECRIKTDDLAKFFNKTPQVIRNMIGNLVKKDFLLKGKKGVRIPNIDKIKNHTQPDPKADPRNNLYVISDDEKNNLYVTEKNLYVTKKNLYVISEPDQPQTVTEVEAPPKDYKQYIKTYTPDENQNEEPESKATTSLPSETPAGEAEPNGSKRNTSKKESKSSNAKPPKEPKQLSQNKIDFDELYEFVRSEILDFPNNYKEDPYKAKVMVRVAQRLNHWNKGITTGGVKKGTVTKDLPVKYPFKAILWAFKDVFQNVKKKFNENSMDFETPENRLNYIFGAITTRIEYQTQEYYKWLKNVKEIDTWKPIIPVFDKRDKLYKSIMSCILLKEVTQMSKEFFVLNQNLHDMIKSGFGEDSKEYRDYKPDYDECIEDIQTRLKDLKSGKVQAKLDLDERIKELYKIENEENWHLRCNENYWGKNHEICVKERKILEEHNRDREKTKSIWKQEFNKKYP